MLEASEESLEVRGTSLAMGGVKAGVARDARLRGRERLSTSRAPRFFNIFC